MIKQPIYVVNVQNCNFLSLTVYFIKKFQLGLAMNKITKIDFTDFTVKKLFIELLVFKT